MKYLLFSLFVFATFPQHCHAQGESQKHLYEKTDALIQQHYASNQPGVAVAVIQDGDIVYSKQQGMANLEYRIPISDSTAFHIASVSKQFTAYLAVLLETEGKLSLNDDVRTHLPELKHLPHKITLRQLANHTHGLPNLFELAQIKGISPANRMTHREVVNMLLNIQQINFKPGERYEYNNTGYVLLAEVIERITKKPFQTVLEARIFKPLGMKNSKAVSNSEQIVRNKAQSYRAADHGYEHHAFNLMANGSSGVSTTIHDLSQWAIHFQKPTTQARTIFQLMQQTSSLSSGAEIEYGLGLEFKQYKGLNVVFHGGGDAGYRAYLLHVPEHQFSIVILGNNNDFAPLEVAYRLLDLYLEQHQTAPPPLKKTTYTAQELTAFEGTYEFCPGAYYTIVAGNDSLYFQPFGQDQLFHLPTIGDGVFSFPMIPTGQFAFYENGFHFHIADFKYPCKKVVLNPPKPTNVNLTAYVGHYKNDALNTQYELIVQNDQLVAVHNKNDDILLKPLSINSFYGPVGFFGQLDFKQNGEGVFDAFLLSGQNFRNLVFRKID